MPHQKRGPEFDFVLLCSSVDLDEKRCALIRDAAVPTLQWELVYDISVRQRTFPLLYETINKVLPEKVPNQILDKLKSIYTENSKYNFYLSFFLTKLLRLLKENKIDAIPFKGPVLAEKVYGAIGRRFFVDLDILVSRADAQAAWNVLTRIGFTPEIEIDDRLKRKYIDNEDDVTFFSRTVGVKVELHWELSGNYLVKPLLFENISNSLKPIVFNSERIRCLSDELLMLYLCIHGAKHEWEYLELICSIAELIKKNSGLNWYLIDDLAKKWRCRILLDLGLYLAWHLLGVSIPEEIQKRIVSQHNLSRIAQNVIVKMFQKNTKFSDRSSRFSSFHLSVRDSRADKLRYVLRLAFSPTQKEWEYFPLPPKFFFLRYLLRPLRLISESLKMKAEGNNA